MRFHPTPGDILARFFFQILLIYLILDPFLPFFQIFRAVRALFRGEDIQKSKSGGQKDVEKFELYLPVTHSCHTHINEAESVSYTSFGLSP